ncbi:MAG TPA: DUF4832 domain-containing protein [Planctomycetota bacterium]|jgi:hypothetical protein
MALRTTGCIALVILLLGAAFAGDAAVTVVSPKPSNEVLLNPGKGWVLYGKAEWQDPKVMAVGNCAYHRFAWSELQPGENQFNWKPLDEMLMGWEKAGKPFAFGVMNANSHSKDPYVTPKWVFDAGAKHRLVDMKNLPNPYAGVPGQKAVPEFQDPVFLAKLKAFLTALAARYDGDPRIAFIDIRSYGNWGEGHMYPFGGRGLNADEFRQHVQMHLDVFKKTRLCISAEGKEHAPVYDWAVLQGVAARRDGICGNSDGRETARAFGHAPGVFEFYGSYSWMKEQGWWDGKKDKNGNGYKLDDCVENGKPSYIGLSQGGKESLKLLEAERALVDQLANRMGYHFSLKEAVIPKAIATAGEASGKFTWLNQGVAPIYVPCVVAIALLDGKDQPLAVCWPEACKPAGWMPGKPVNEDVVMKFAKVAKGEYRLAVGLVQRAGDDKPYIKLGIEGRTPTGWYPLGPVLIK